MYRTEHEDTDTDLLMHAAKRFGTVAFFALFVSWFVAAYRGAHYFFQVHHPLTAEEIFLDYCAATFIPFFLTFFRRGPSALGNGTGKTVLLFLALTGVVTFLAGSASSAAWAVEGVALLYLPYAVFTRSFWKLSRQEKKRAIKHWAVLVAAAIGLTR